MAHCGICGRDDARYYYDLAAEGRRIELDRQCRDDVRDRNTQALEERAQSQEAKADARLLTDPAVDKQLGAIQATREPQGLEPPGLSVSEAARLRAETEGNRQRLSEQERAQTTELGDQLRAAREAGDRQAEDRVREQIRREAEAARNQGRER
jgi:hypothetical protein